MPRASVPAPHVPATIASVTRPHMPTWATSLLVAVPCSVLASLLTILVMQRELPAPAQAEEGTREVLRELADLQRRMDARLAGLEQAVAAQDAAAVPVREQVGAPPPGIDRLASLIERLTSVLAQQRAMGGPAPVLRDRPVNHAALAELHMLAKRDYGAARRATMLLTEEELLTRYGLPDEVSSHEGHDVSWNYYHYGTDGKRNGGTCFNLKEGRVLWHEISIPD